MINAALIRKIILVALPLGGCATAPTPPVAAQPMPQATPAQAPAASEPEATSSKLSYGMVKSRLKKGITTQAEIIALFGAPNIVTKNANKNEVWVYSKQSSTSSSTNTGTVDVEAQARLKSFFGFYAAEEMQGRVNSAQQTRTTSNVSSIDLIITYDNNDVMIDYSVVASQF
jgi:hypothetical protein